MQTTMSIPLEDDPLVVLVEFEKSLAAIGKGSKLHIHNVNMEMMGNFLQAYTERHHMEERFINAHQALAAAILKIQARKGRGWLTYELIAAQEAYNFLKEILEVTDPVTLKEMSEYIAQCYREGRWLTYDKKHGFVKPKMVRASRHRFR